SASCAPRPARTSRRRGATPAPRGSSPRRKARANPETNDRGRPMTITISAPELTEFITRIFEGVGSPPSEAAQIAEHLVGSNLRGHDSHGVIRTFGYVQMVREERLKPGAPITIERETPSTALVSGGWNLGVPVALQAMDLAIRKAKETGVAFVSMHEAGHIGRVGAYGD